MILEPAGKFAFCGALGKKVSRSRFLKNYDIVLPWGELAHRYDFLFNTKKKEGWISPPASKSEIYQQKKTFSTYPQKYHQNKQAILHSVKLLERR